MAQTELERFWKHLLDRALTGILTEWGTHP